MELIDGKTLAKKIRNELKIEVENLKKQRIKPKLAVIMVRRRSSIGSIRT